MITLARRSDDPFEYEEDRLGDLITGVGAAIVAVACTIAIGVGIAGVLTGSHQQAIDPSRAVTFNGQVFGGFQPEEVNTFYGTAETIRGKPLAIDPLWNRILPRNEITIDGVVYNDCTGEKPVVNERTRFQELVCERRH